jgi:hypothetical protein
LGAAAPKGTAANNLANSVTGALNLGPFNGDGSGLDAVIIPGVGSAAIDAVVCGSTTTIDQRGVARPQGARCDIGAVEVVVPQTLTVSVTGTGAVSASTVPAPQSGIISNCINSGGANCSASYATAQSLVLIAMVPPGQKLAWGGACLAAGTATTATVTMNSVQHCTVAFAVISPAVPAPAIERWTAFLLGGLLTLGTFWRVRRNATRA